MHTGRPRTIVGRTRNKMNRMRSIRAFVQTTFWCQHFASPAPRYRELALPDYGVVCAAAASVVLYILTPRVGFPTLRLVAVTASLPLLSAQSLDDLSSYVKRRDPDTLLYRATVQAQSRLSMRATVSLCPLVCSAPSQRPSCRSVALVSLSTAAHAPGVALSSCFWASWFLIREEWLAQRRLGRGTYSEFHTWERTHSTSVVVYSPFLSLAIFLVGEEGGLEMRCFPDTFP